VAAGISSSVGKNNHFSRGSRQKKTAQGAVYVYTYIAKRVCGGVSREILKS